MIDRRQTWCSWIERQNHRAMSRSDFSKEDSQSIGVFQALQPSTPEVLRASWGSSLSMDRECLNYRNQSCLLFENGRVSWTRAPWDAKTAIGSFVTWSENIYMCYLVFPCVWCWCGYHRDKTCVTTAWSPEVWATLCPLISIWTSDSF